MLTHLSFGKAVLHLDPETEDFHIEFHTREDPAKIDRARLEAFLHGFVEDDGDPYDMQEFVGDCLECASYCTTPGCITLHVCAIYRLYLVHRDALTDIEEYDMPSLVPTAYGPFSGFMEAVK